METATPVVLANTPFRFTTHSLGTVAAQANDSRHGQGDSSGLIKARHGGDSQAALDELQETPEEIANKFSGTCKRMTALQAGVVYWKSGGMLLGLVSVFVFAVAQTTRIMGDWWIRYVAAGKLLR